MDAACDDGRLPALPRRHSMIPPWHPGYTARTWTAAWQAFHLIVDYPFDVEPIPSWGSPEDLAWVERITHERVAPADAVQTAALRSPRRLGILRVLVSGYGRAMPWLFPLAAVGWLFCAGLTLYRRAVSWLFVLGTALALGMMGNVAVVALVEATSWPAITTGYLGASVPLAVCRGHILRTCLGTSPVSIWAVIPPAAGHGRGAPPCDSGPFSSGLCGLAARASPRPSCSPSSWPRPFSSPVPRA